MSTYTSNSSVEFDFSNSSNLNYVEKAIMGSIGNISSTEATLGVVFGALSDIVALIPSVTSILLTAATAVVEITGDKLAEVVGGVSGVVKSTVGFVNNL